MSLVNYFFTTIEMDSIPFYKIIAVVLSFQLLGSWKWEIVGIGTLFAMVYVGVTVRLFSGFDFSGFSGEGGGFSSFFEQLFGGAGKGSRSRGTRSRSARTNAGEMNANVNIDLYTALLGGEVILQLTCGHKIKLKVKPETQNGTKVRLRGKGYDRGDGTMGDLIITYNVMLPTNLSERQKQLLNEMRNA